MRINKESIHENKIKCTNTLQITLDDDFNVPDSRPDIDTIIKEHAKLRMEPVKAQGEHAQITGTMDFAILYIGERENDGRHFPVKMTGSMPVNENINLSEDADNTYVSCESKIDDITVKTINSRKVSIKAIVTLNVISEQLEDVSVGNDIEDESDEDVLQIHKQSVDYAQLAVNLRDNLRIRESIQLPESKPEAAELLWEDLDIKSMDTRLTDDGVDVNGELGLFVMYQAADDSQSVQWYETNVPFDGKLDINGCSADMVSYIKYNAVNTNIEVKPDYDGANREINVEMTMDMDVKVYEERNTDIISDIYSPVKQVTCENNTVTFKKLLVRNNSKCRAVDTIKADDYVNVLQICNCTGTAQIDDIEVDDEGVQVDGAVIVNVFYVTADDNAPMGSLHTAIPFSNKIQAKNDGRIEYSIEPHVEQLTAVMTGTNEIQIKAVVSLDMISFEPFEANAVMECSVEPFEENEFLKFPSIIGYIANGEETLWDIAKKYHTTTESIRLGNKNITDCVSDDCKIKTGDKLLLVKAAR